MKRKVKSEASTGFQLWFTPQIVKSFSYPCQVVDVVDVVVVAVVAVEDAMDVKET